MYLHLHFILLPFLDILPAQNKLLRADLIFDLICFRVAWMGCYYFRGGVMMCLEMIDGYFEQSTTCI